MANVKVKLLVPRTGPDINQVVGDEIEVDAETAERMMAAGQCELVRKGASPETTKATRARKASKKA